MTADISTAISINTIELSDNLVYSCLPEMNELITGLSRNIISLGHSINPSYVHISLLCHAIVEEISSPDRNSVSNEARRAEYAQLLVLTEELLKRDRQDHIINSIAINLVENNKPRNTFWKKLGIALLAVTGGLLFLVGTLAICSGFGVLPGGFLAAAGTTLAGMTGLTAGSGLMTGISAGSIATGAAGMLGAAYAHFGIFQQTVRQNLKSSICDLTGRPKNQ